MFRNYLLVALRYLTKNKAISSINIVGLAIGIASGILIFQYVNKELTFDKFWANYNDIYRISYEQFQEGKFQVESAKTFRGIARALKEDMPEVEDATTLGRDIITVYTPDEQIQDVIMFWTDTCFFKVFERRFLYGNANNPFPDVHASVISESLAMALFGSKDVLGERFKLNEGWEYYISGVFEDIPAYSHFHAEMLMPFSSLRYYMRNYDYATSQLTNKFPDAGIEPAFSSQGYWNLNRTNNPASYIKLQKGINPKVVEGKILPVLEKYMQHFKEQNVTCKFFMQPVSSIHLNSNLEGEIEVNGNKTMVFALAVLALIILVLAWMNFINLSLAQALDRVRETSMRKVLGARRKQLVQQFLVEAVLINIISAGLAFVMVLALRGAIVQITNGGFHFKIDGEFILSYFIVVIAGAVISGIVPALVLSAIKPVGLFSKKIRMLSQGVDLKRALVVAQFAATIVLIICTVTVYKQVRFMQTQDLGVNISRTIYSFSPMSMLHKPNEASKRESLRSVLENIPELESFTTSSTVPGQQVDFQSEDVKLIGSDKQNSVSYSLVNSDYAFFDTYKIKLLAGRLFWKDQESESESVIVNETAMNQLGFNQPLEALNHFISIGNQQLKIIGVVRNHHQESLRKAIQPILYRYSYQWYKSVGLFSFKIKTNNVKNTIAKIEKAWYSVYPEDKFQYRFLEDSYNAQYNSDILFGKIFALFSLLAIAIACFGLLGLSIFTSKHRIKEIGIRKVNGAKVFQVMAMLNKGFMIWILVAYAIACPVAWYLMQNWLQNFAFKTNLSLWIFILAGFMALGIALVTVSFQSWRAATRNPVEALRYE